MDTAQKGYFLSHMLFSFQSTEYLKKAGMSNCQKGGAAKKELNGKLQISAFFDWAKRGSCATFRKELMLLGSWASTPPEHFDILGLIKRGLPMGGLITHWYHMEDGVAAFEKFGVGAAVTSQHERRSLREKRSAKFLILLESICTEDI